MRNSGVVARDHHQHRENSDAGYVSRSTGSLLSAHVYDHPFATLRIPLIVMPSQRGGRKDPTAAEQPNDPAQTERSPFLNLDEVNLATANASQFGPPREPDGPREHAGRVTG